MIFFSSLKLKKKIWSLIMPGCFKSSLGFYSKTDISRKYWTHTNIWASNIKMRIMYWGPNMDMALHKDKNVYTGHHSFMRVIEKGEAYDIELYHFSHQTLPSLFSNCVLASLFLLSSITLIQDFFSSHADYGRIFLTDLIDSCLSA